MVEVEAFDQTKRKTRLAVGVVRGNEVLSGFLYDEVTHPKGGDDSYGGCHGQDQPCM